MPTLAGCIIKTILAGKQYAQMSAV